MCQISKIIAFFFTISIFNFSFSSEVYLFGQKDSDSQEYLLKVGEVTYTLKKQEGRLLPQGQEFPRRLLPELHVLMVVAEQEANINPRELLSEANSYGTDVPQLHLQNKLAKACIEKAREYCLTELFEYSQFPEVKAVSQVGQAIFAEEYGRKLTLLKVAKELDPEGAFVQTEIQKFGLLVAEQVLKHHEKLLRENGIWKKLGMDPPSDDNSAAGSYWDSFCESLLNTTHSLSILLTDYEDDLLVVWSDQLNQTTDLKMAVRWLRKEIESEGLPLSREAVGNEQNPQALVRPALHFLRSSFGSALLSGEILTNSDDQAVLPEPRLMGVDDEIDFVNWDWGTFAVTQVNVLNVYMVFRGEAMLAALAKTKYARWVAGTRFGQFVGSKLGVAALQAKVAQWPEGARKFFMWFMADMVLDGCLLRYAYIGYSALTAEDDQATMSDN